MFSFFIVIAVLSLLLLLVLLLVQNLMDLLPCDLLLIVLVIESSLQNLTEEHILMRTHLVLGDVYSTGVGAEGGNPFGVLIDVLVISPVPALLPVNNQKYLVVDVVERRMG